jgi:hypothetical protein
MAFDHQVFCVVLFDVFWNGRRSRKNGAGPGVCMHWRCPHAITHTLCERRTQWRSQPNNPSTPSTHNQQPHNLTHNLTTPQPHNLTTSNLTQPCDPQATTHVAVLACVPACMHAVLCLQVRSRACTAHATSPNHPCNLTALGWPRLHTPPTSQVHNMLFNAEDEREYETGAKELSAYLALGEADMLPSSHRRITKSKGAGDRITKSKGAGDKRSRTNKTQSTSRENVPTVCPPQVCHARLRCSCR